MPTEITTIWNNFHKELKGYVIRTVHNHADADDIMQEVFLKILHHMDKINQAGNLRQYLYGIVRNATYDYFKHQSRKNADAEFIDVFLEEDPLSLNVVVADCLKPFIDQLPSKYREALLISEFQDVSQKELAERLHISYSGAKSRVQRGKEKLKELLLACCTFQSDIYGNIVEVEKNKCKCA